MDGQLWPAERAFLHRIVQTTFPKLVFEVGTWQGGGSTWQICHALMQLRQEHGHVGRLHTCENDRAMFNIAAAHYATPEFEPYVSCHAATSVELMDEFDRVGLIPDLVFFDGPEDPAVALHDFQRLQRTLPVGAHFCMHDYDVGIRADGLESHKAVLLRPYLEELCTQGIWNIVEQLSAPVSVGMIWATRIR